MVPMMLRAMWKAFLSLPKRFQGHLACRLRPSTAKTLGEPQAHLDVVDQNIDLASRHVEAGCVDVEGVVLHAFIKYKVRRRRRPN